MIDWIEDALWSPIEPAAIWQATKTQFKCRPIVWHVMWLIFTISEIMFISMDIGVDMALGTVGYGDLFYLGSVGLWVFNLCLYFRGLYQLQKVPKSDMELLKVKLTLAVWKEITGNLDATLTSLIATKNAGLPAEATPMPESFLNLKVEL